MKIRRPRFPAWLNRSLLGVLCGSGFWLLPLFLSEVRQHYPEGLKSLLMPMSVLLAGVAAAGVQSCPGRSITRLLTASTVGLAAGCMMLVTIYPRLVVRKSVVSDQGTKTRAVVKSWKRAADCPCGPEHAASEDGASPVDDVTCVAGLAFKKSKIAQCWGENRVWTSKILVSFAFLFLSVGLGSFIGCLLAWISPTEHTLAPPVVECRHTIFISYRRADVGGLVDSIRSYLVRHLGEQAIKIDVYDISWGEDFEERIQDFIEECDVVLAVIGENWLEELISRRGTKDHVRLEIKAALQKNKKLMPLLVNAEMPGKESLPADIRDISARNAMAIHSAGQFFGRDMNWVVWSLLEDLGYARLSRG